MKTKKKYLMLVFEENSDKSLEFYSDNPYRGRLSDIVYGDNVKELNCYVRNVWQLILLKKILNLQ